MKGLNIMGFNRFDIVEAYYAYCVDYHSGQFSDLYKKLCRIEKYFTPSPMFNGYWSLTENGKKIYDKLEGKRQYKNLSENWK